MASDPGASPQSWIRLATQRGVVMRSVAVAAVVGSILVVINQGNVLFNGAASPELLWKIPLTYCVPYAVSTYAAVDAILARQ